MNTKSRATSDEHQGQHVDLEKHQQIVCPVILYNCEKTASDRINTTRLNHCNKSQTYSNTVATYVSIHPDDSHSYLPFAYNEAKDKVWRHQAKYISPLMG